MHSPAGRYNALALSYVLQQLKPDVIFEELPVHLHSIVYNDETLQLVEIDAIKMYLNYKDVHHIPVDTYLSSNTHYKHEQELSKAIANASDTNESTELRLHVKKCLELISQQGLPILNSDESEVLFAQQQRLEYEVFKQINDDRLLQLFRERKEIIDKREYEIINNIYRYSENNQFEQAIMFIGFGHRGTILKVIEKFEVKKELKLNWSLYQAHSIESAPNLY